MDELEKFNRDKDLLRHRMDKYTRQAFSLLPAVDRPRILDIGCGAGVPTMTLAGLCNGTITAIDTDQAELERLINKISQAGLDDRITVINKSMLAMDFPDNSFDIIWAEGSIFAAGFEQGLRDWKRIVRHGGYLGIHDDRGNVSEKLDIISAQGYLLVDYFIMDTGIWMDDYYDPLQELVRETRNAGIHGDALSSELSRQQSEIDMVNRNPGQCTSVFFILQRPDNQI